MKRLRLSSDEKTEFIKDVTSLIDRGTISQLKDLSGLITKLDEKNIVKPTVFVRADVMHKMEALVKQSTEEISWHCLVKRNKEENCYLIYDILLFPQTNTGVTTTTDQDEYAEWLRNIMMDEDESKFDDMRMHGHSHVNMNVYSSGVDDSYQTELLTNIKDGDYYIFMILNKKKDICTLLYDYEQQVMFENADIDLRIVTNDKTDITNWATRQIKEFCKTMPKPINNNINKGYPRYGRVYEDYIPEELPSQYKYTKYLK